MMRDRMERFVLLPFSVGCISESSIAVAVQQQPSPLPRRSSSLKSAAAAGPETQNSSTTAIENREEDEESISSDSMKSSFRFLPNAKPDLSTGFNRLCKSFKNFSQLFAYKEEEMELENEMEIGLPTDVKHVTHIGLDGCTTTNNNQSSTNNHNNNNNSTKGNNWETLLAPGLLSLGQFELSMAAPAATKADDREEEEEDEALPAEALVKKKKNIIINNNNINSVNKLN